jgi:histidine ammonia-lyase
MCGVGVLALYDTMEMARAADILAAMCFEAQLGIKKALT